jgi:thioredoxin reductase
MEPDLDVVVVGRSFAGLSAALTLGRVRRSVLVIGSGGPRNDAVLHAHGLLTRDGANPTDLVAAAEADLAKYPTVQLVDGRVDELSRDGAGFRVSFDGRTSTAGKVILATGVNDDPPPIPGLAEHWGRGVFTCPFCDGFEHQDLPLAVVGDPAMAPHLAQLLTALSERVTVHASGLAPDVAAALGAAGVAVDPREVVRVVGDGSAVSGLELGDRSVEPTGAVFVAGMPHPNNQLALSLGCSVDELGYVTVDAAGGTDVDGVWAAGDLTTTRHQMTFAIAQGTSAAADCAKALILGAAPSPPPGGEGNQP